MARPPSGTTHHTIQVACVQPSSTVTRASQVEEPADPPSRARAASLMLPYLMGHRTRIIADAAAAAAATATRAPAPAAINPQPGPGSQGEKVGGSGDVAGNTDTALSRTDARGSPADSNGSSCSSQAATAAAAACVSPDQARALTVIDTAIAAALALQGEDTGSLLRFVQASPNWVDLEEGEQVGWAGHMHVLFEASC